MFVLSHYLVVHSQADGIIHSAHRINIDEQSMRKFKTDKTDEPLHNSEQH